MTKQEKDNRVPLWERMNLTLEEAAAYTGIGTDKLRELSNRESCDFVLWVGTKRLLNLNKALRRMMRDCNDEILEKYGADSDPVLLPQFSCHILRHTFATRLCESGANLKFIQSILGHADVSTTMNIYVDVTDALKKKEITAFDDYMTTKLET